VEKLEIAIGNLKNIIMATNTKRSPVEKSQLGRWGPGLVIKESYTEPGPEENNWDILLCNKL
jgi:hypothetical protein